MRYFCTCQYVRDPWKYTLYLRWMWSCVGTKMFMLTDRWIILKAEDVEWEPQFYMEYRAKGEWDINNIKINQKVLSL